MSEVVRRLTMALSLSLTLLLSFVSFLPICSEGKPTEQCVYQINSCACKTQSGYINLEPLDTAKQTRDPYFQYIIDGYNDANYAYNPCTAFSSSSPCQHVAVCQTTGDGLRYALGTQESARFSTNSKNETILEYMNTTVGRSMKVLLLCEPEEEGDILFFAEDPQLTYTFVLKTKYACADLAPPPHWDNSTTVKTTATTPTSTTTSTDGCHCEGGVDMRSIIATLVTVTFCLCALILVTGFVVLLINKCKSAPCVTPKMGNQGHIQHQYQTLSTD